MAHREPGRDRPDDDDYQQLLRFRTELRRFLHWSANRATAAGLTPAHHQLLLAIRGHPTPGGPTISDVASKLFLQHHSAVGLVDRAEAAGLIRRVHDHGDARVVRLSLTPSGSRRLKALSAAHLEEIRRLAPVLDALVGEPDRAAV